MNALISIYMNRCPICNIEYKQITVQHIRKHKLSVDDFKLKYPNVVLCNINAITKIKNKTSNSIILDNIRCLHCNTLIISSDRKKRKFCSHICSASYYAKDRKIADKICSICGNNVKGRNVTKHDRNCSITHTKEHKYMSYVKKWLDGTIQGYYNDINYAIKPFVRRFLFEKYNNKCQKCGWSVMNEFTNMIPLHVHHIDGNCMNTQIDNLELLCPNCHSLTKTHGSHNNGNSKRERYTKSSKSINATVAE